MKKSVTAVIAAIMIICCVFSGCNKYNSDYSAVGLVQNDTPKTASMRFISFKGIMVYQMKSEAGESLFYNASIEQGEINVYYDFDGNKNKLCTVREGKPIQSKLALPGEVTVFVIVEANEKCKNGDISFDISE